MVVDLKVLDSIVCDDDPEHIKISFGESFFLELANVLFFCERLNMYFCMNVHLLPEQLVAVLLLLLLLLLLFLLLLWGGGFATKLYHAKGESLAKVQLKIGGSSPCHI